MPTKKYMIKDERHYRRPLVARLVDYALTALLFCTSCFGMVVGALWALGRLEMWMT
jgi:hypothetical protein